MREPKTLLKNIIEGKKKNGDSYAIKSIKQTLQMLTFICDNYLGEFLSPQEIKSIKKPFTDAFDEYKYISGEEDQTRSERFVPTFDDFLSAVAEEYGYEGREFLLVACYSVLTCRDDYTQMTIIDNPAHDSKKTNHLLIHNDQYTFILNKYKTRKHYDVITFHLSKTIDEHQRLEQLIRNWIGKNNLTSGDFLFVIKGPLSKVASAINKKLGYKDMGGTNMYRHMRVSQRFPNTTFQERKELAKSMGHTLMTQKKYLNEMTVNGTAVSKD